MNEALKNIMSRRSVKAYKPEMPSQELIDQVVEAGTHAPTGMNRQSPIIIEVTDKAVRDKLSKMNADVMGAKSTRSTAHLSYWSCLRISRSEPTSTTAAL